MRCLFCKQDSSTSKSVEHVIPESLGNRTVTLPPGVVCDACNNYFSRKVEKPFLESGAISYLRFYQAVPSKKGRVPPMDGILDFNFSAQLQHTQCPELPMVLSLGPEAIEHIFTTGGGHLIVPAGGEPPSDIVASRFLAKVALEAMAARLVRYPEGLEYLVNEAQLDALRDHARKGSTSRWPISVRRIYDADARVTGENGGHEQVVHESDILVTEAGEWYFVMALFGLELAINFAGPAIDGYATWLAANGGASPLYIGRNAGAEIPKSAG